MLITKLSVYIDSSSDIGFMLNLALSDPEKSEDRDLAIKAFENDH